MQTHSTPPAVWPGGILGDKNSSKFGNFGAIFKNMSFRLKSTVATCEVILEKWAAFLFQQLVTQAIHHLLGATMTSSDMPNSVTRCLEYLFDIFANYNNDRLPNTIKSMKSMSQFGIILNEPLQNCKRIFKFCPSYENSPNWCQNSFIVNVPDWKCLR